MEEKCKKAKWLSEEDLQIAVKRREVKSEGEKEMKKVKWLSEKALQIAEERREVKGKGERERYTQLNAEFPKDNKERKERLLKWTMQRKGGKEENAKD